MKGVVQYVLKLRPSSSPTHIGVIVEVAVEDLEEGALLVTLLQEHERQRRLFNEVIDPPDDLSLDLLSTLQRGSDDDRKH